LTKADLTHSLNKKTQLHRNKSLSIVESLLETIKSTLESGEEVMISGFGKFSAKDKNKRKGRNPQTGEDAILRPRRVVRFKPSGVMREKINGNRG
jgi:integration host factor subunit alpha